MKIKNKKKFVRAIIVFVIMIIISIVLINKTYSKGEVKYREEYVCAGDTLWSISKEERKNNKYFENKDIRDIVSEIKKINDLASKNIIEGDKIKIPEYK